MRASSAWRASCCSRFRSAACRSGSIASSAKTVLIWGDSDRLVPPVYAQAFKKGIAGAELAAIPEAGHMVIWEKTAAVMAALERLK